MTSPPAPRIFRLTDRNFIAVSGPDAAEFLNGLVSNEVTRAGPNSLVYAALLTPQGKYLFDFFILRPQPDHFLLDLDAPRAGDLVKRLSIYKLRSKVTIADVSADWATLIYDRNPNLPDSAADPRHSALGFRRIAPASEIVSDTWDYADYRNLMLDHAIPDHGRDLIVDKTFLMDANFDVIHGVDFKKGCYVGQELTARMKHRASNPRALVTVQFEGTPPAPGTPILAGEREIGITASGFGNRTLASFRLDKLADARTADLTAAGIKLTPSKP
jgi:folate-binding protein YgfZ